MAEIKPQVYKDPRPAEYFTQFHEAARKGVGWTYTLGRIVLTLPTLLIYRVRKIGLEHVPRDGRVDPRPQPLQPDGPLLRRRLPAAEDPLHGEIADVRAAGADLHLQARRGLPGSPRAPRRGGDHDRQRDPPPGRDAARLCRGWPLALRRARQAETGDRPDRAGIGRPGRPGRDPRLGQGARLEAAALPQGHGPVRRADQLPGRAARRAASASSRSATEIFARVREMYEGLATRSELRSAE